jgi:hypothetical protein
VQERGRRCGHPRPARTGGEHILEDPVWITEPPGHPPGRRIHPQQDAATPDPRAYGPATHTAGIRCTLAVRLCKLPNTTSDALRQGAVLPGWQPATVLTVHL